MKNRLKAYLAKRQKNNADRQQTNRHIPLTLHELREERDCLDALTVLVDHMDEEPAVSAVSERDKQDRERIEMQEKIAERRKKEATERRHKGKVL